MAKSNVIQKPSKVLFDRCLAAIKLDKKIKEEVKLLEEDKVWLRENGPLGETMAIPGHGSIQFKNGAAAKPGGEAFTTYKFHPDKYESLTPKMRRKLRELGIVEITSGVTNPTPAGTPSITFIHNQ